MDFLQKFLEMERNVAKLLIAKLALNVKNNLFQRTSTDDTNMTVAVKP